MQKKSNLSMDYINYIKLKKIYIIFLFIILIFSFVVSLSVGSSSMSVIDSIKTLIGEGTSKEINIIYNIRLPRVLGGMLVGASIALSGMVIQTVLNNPLASPSTIGISGASAFGANIALIILARFGMEINSEITAITSFAFSLICMILVISISALRGTDKTSVILAGVAFNSLFTAGTTVIQYFADDTEIATAVSWTFGDLGKIDYYEVKIVTIVLLISSILIYAFRWKMNSMDMGEATAHTLGINTKKMRNLFILIATINTGVSVAFVGMIGFVGLLAPQIAKRIVADDKRYMFPFTLLTGSIIVLASDAFARTIASPLVLPVGAVTSFLGAPMFIYILLKER